MLEQKTLKLDLGFRKQFPWVFTVADLDLAVLGMNDLERYEFLVDIKKATLHTESQIHEVSISYTDNRQQS